MKFLRSVAAVLSNSFRPLLLMNLVYFGLVGAGMAYGAWDQSVSDAIHSELKSEVPQQLPTVYDAYLGGHFVNAVALTFVINFCVGSLLFITLPSLVLPFSGVALGATRAVYWGLMFSPNFGTLSFARVATGALIAGLIMLEGEAYVLAMLASYVHGKSWLAPARVGATSRWQGYKFGAFRTLNIYALIAIVLAVAAIYEATLVILVIPWLK
jgi:hypothetical protein